MTIIQADPTNHYTKETPKDLLDYCGLIPWWFHESDDNTLTAEEIIDKNYVVPFSTNLMTGFEVTEDHVLKYPEDPDLYPYVQFDHNDSTVRIYPHGITAITTDGDTKIARLD